tara:strand:+ start:524 stop:931 length:408 start_codon:yes stop_codon:yes gene_type:complete
MADVAITAANVISVSGSIDRSKNAGATISQGQCVYLDSSNEWQLTDVDLSAAAKACAGVSLNSALDGQPLAVQKNGLMNFGAIFTEGLTYMCSDTAGGIGPSADTGSGDDAIILGNAVTTSQLRIAIVDSGGSVA